MKKFEVEVARVDKYQVKINEEIITEEWMKNYREYFYDIFTLEEHAKNIAQGYCRSGDSFIEGYGTVKINGRLPYAFAGDPDLCGIDIQIVSEDEDIETTVRR